MTSMFESVSEDLGSEAVAESNPNNAYYVIVASTVLFYLLSRLVVLARPQTVDDKATWKWKNITISLIHSILSSFWAVKCFYERPDMAEDLITVYTPLSRSLVAFSIGYFVYDFFDLIICQPSRESYELLGHHSVILVCFMVPIVHFQFVGYAVVALLVEFNSIFLHTRQLQRLCGVDKFGSWYRLNSLLNLGTFIVFRILLLAWMTRWILINKDSVPLMLYTMGNLGLAVMVTMNSILFYRLLRSDLRVLRGDKSSSKAD